VSYRATERQIEIMKEMGVNSIRTSHNPPSNELLELCDKMGVIVMDEAFDMWRMGKTKYDYSLDFDKWHERDLTDQVLRDRNHPSVFMWSIGNEIVEQWGEDTITTNLQQANVLLNNRKVNDKSGKLGKNAQLTKHLADIVKNLDKTRLVTAACNGTDENNPLFRAEALTTMKATLQPFRKNIRDYRLYRAKAFRRYKRADFTSCPPTV
jgi:beta-galactosidase